MHINTYRYVYIYIYIYWMIYAQPPQDLHFSGFGEPKSQIETIRVKSEPQRARERERDRMRESKNAGFCITCCIVAALSLKSLKKYTFH